MKKKNFEEKIKSMKFSQIMKAMIDGLKKPVTNINMGTFGTSEERKKDDGIPYIICWGCAATNAVLKISNIKTLEKHINTYKERSEIVDCEEYFLIKFEVAIDALRQGSSYVYNFNASKIEIAQIPAEFKSLIDNLPPLETSNYEERLPLYEKAYKSIKKAGY